jgi:type IV secretion system protein VirB9
MSAIARRLGRVAVCLLALAAGADACADPRIRELDYDDRKVVRIDGCFGFQTMVEFAADERIENVGLGEAAHWLVVPNKRANLLFVKPAYRNSHSNMTVVTDRRRYSFELVASDSPDCRRGRVVYDLRFRYPEDVAARAAAAAVAATAAQAGGQAPVQASAALPAPAQRNSAYSFSGARENVPLRVFDDGRSTYFQWADASSTPAVYALASDGSQTPLTFTRRGDYLVADQIAPAFALRRGNAVAQLFNDGFRAPALDAQSPQPRAAAAASARRPAWWPRKTDDAH